MRDDRKSRKQLIDELGDLRKRVAKLETSVAGKQAEPGENGGKQAEESLENSLSLLHATIESTFSGILVIDMQGKIASHNQRFIEMWQIPESILTSKNNGKIIRFVTKQLKRPEKFLQKIADLENQEAVERCDFLECRDGRIFEGFSKPLRIDEKTVGRVWSFLDATDRMQTEKNFSQSEARYRMLYENNPSMYFTVNGAGMVISVNQFGAKQLGYSVDELLGQPVMKVFHKEDQPKISKQLKQCLRNPDQLHRWELRKLRKDGSTLWVEEFARVVPDLNDQSTIFIVCQDITERQMAAEELREMSLALTYTMPGISRLDRNGKYVSANDVYARMLGYEPDDLVSTGCLQTVHPDDLQIVNEAFQRMSENGSANFEARRLHKNGSIIYNELLIVKRVDKDDNVVGHNCFAKDISQRKQAENEIERLQNFYSFILDSLPIQLAVFDVDGHFQYLNPAAVSDPKMRKWLIGKTEFDYCRKRKLSTKIASERRAAFDTSVKERNVFSVTEEFPCRKNGLRYIVRSLSPMIDEKGEVMHVLGYSMDITEKKIAQQSLQRAYDELETRVKERTVELTDANKTLVQEIRERKRAEEELKISEERFKRLFEFAPDGYYLNDLTGKFIDGNRAAEELSGHAKEELIGKNLLKSNLLSPDQIPKAAANLAKNALGKQAGPDEFIVTRKDGSKIPLEISAIPIRIRDKKLVLATARDISERKHSENALRESKERYHNIFETAAVSIWEEDYSELKLALDNLREKGVRDFRKFIDEHPEFLQEAAAMIKVLDVNDTTLKMYEAKSKSQLLGTIDKILTSESFQSFKEQIAAIAENKRYFETETINCTLLGKPINILLRINIPSQKEKFSSVLISIMDITKRKQAEEALRQSEERFSKAFHKTPVAIAISHIESARFIDINNRFLETFGYERDELIGQSALDLGMWCNPEDRIKMRNEIAEKGSTRNFETKIKAKNGTVHEIQTGVELIELDGKTCILAMIEDVTERNRAREAKERLRQKNIRSAAIVEAQENERRRISRELHDGIGQILTAVKFNFETLEETLKIETDEQSTLFREIKGQLSNAVSEGERISYNLMPRVLDDFGIVPTLERLCKEISNHSSTRVQFYSHNPPGRLKANIEMGLYRIAQEALNNIAKHANAREATVQIVHHPSSVNLIIEDDGSGFLADENEVINGNGMGLINMRERAEALNGTFTIHAEAGKGTELIIELPLTEPARSE